MMYELSPDNRFEARARLGEGPVWDARAQCLYWVDIYNYRVHRFDPHTLEERILRTPEIVTCAVPTLSDNLLVTLRHEIALLDCDSGEVRTIQALEEDRPDSRFNDGKCDALGRFWVGTMSPDNPERSSLYRFDTDGTVRTMESGVTISNGLGWSPDGRTFYYTDSPRRVIFAYEHDPETGSLGKRRVFADLTTGSAFPDGLTVDAEGCVWSAQWDGWCIIRFAPDGREMARLPLPVQRPTSCAFGGADLKTLYITSASVGLSEAEIQKCPLSGDLFWIDSDVPGLPMHPFGAR